MIEVCVAKREERGAHTCGVPGVECDRPATWVVRRPNGIRGGHVLQSFRTCPNHVSVAVERFMTVEALLA